MKKATPNLIVESIEQSLQFWVQRLGFEKAVEVPHGDRLGFVILRKEAVDLMLQSRASLRDDVPVVAEDAYRACLYLEVEDLAPIRAALAGWPTLIPERKTFYGATEIIVRDPDGNVVAFAAHG